MSPSGGDLIDPVQDAVETLAVRLHRSVAVDGPDLVLVCHSTHFGDADQARLDVLVGRAVSGALRDYVLGAGVRSWREPTVLPAAPHLGSEHDRICFPLRSRYELVGWMWVMDAHREPLSPAELEVAVLTAQQLTAALSRRREARNTHDEQAGAALLGLLSGVEDERRHAAEDLHGLGLFTGLAWFVGLRVSTVLDPAEETGHDGAGDLRRALGSALQSYLRGSYAVAVNGTDAHIAVGYRREPEGAETARLAEAISTALVRLNAALGAAVRVGVGNPCQTLEDCSASFDQASSALRVAGARGRRTVVWADEPVDTLLAAALSRRLDPQLVPPVLRDLALTQSEDTLTMIEKYLDLAGNVNLTAERLSVHRTTVYYRLGRFQETTGLDLDDGNSRLMLQLWFKAADFLRSTP